MSRPVLAVLAVLFLIALGGGGTACQTAAPPPAQPAAAGRVVGTAGGTLRYRVSTPVKTFNYLTAMDEPSLVASFFLMGGRLAEYDHDRQSYVPALAESWEAVDDGRTFRVTLREGARFSDGQPITAHDVEFTLRAVYDERTAAALFRDPMLINGQEIVARVVDARHLEIIFPEQVAAPESYLSNVAVLPRHVLEEELKKGALREAYSLAADPQRVVTAGAFVPERAIPGESVTLRRNPHYWKKDAAGNSLPYFDAITIETVADTNNAVARLTQGSLDVVDRIRATDYAALPRVAAGNSSVRAYDLGPGLNTEHVWFNLNAGARDGRPIVDPVKLAWFGDVRFRRAVSHAIDREAIATTAFQGLATPLYGFVSPGNRAWGAADLPRTLYDPARSRSLLNEAGFTVRGTEQAPELYDAGGRRVELTLLVPAENEPRKAMAAMIQEDLARLGIAMQIAPLEFGEVTRRWSQSYDYDAVLLGTVLTDPDPSSYMGTLTSRGTSHFWWPKQERPATDWERRLDELAVAQSHERDHEKRRALFREAQLILAEQLPLIPLVARHTTAAASTRLGNYRPSPVAPYSLWNADELFLRK